MKGLKLWRTFQEGCNNYTRNGWLTAATIVVFTLSLFIVSLTAMFGVAANLMLESMQQKINVNVSFNPDVSEERILNIKRELEKYQQVASVEYISRERALEEFLADSGNDPVVKQALDEIGENPLLASLTIKARDPGQYEKIAEAIKQGPFKEEVDRINYERNKRAIDKLNHIRSASKETGILLGALFIGIALLISFNTIRMNMYARKQEFEIMRLVGASNLYVRMPQVFEGIFYGLSAAALTAILLFGAVKGINPYTENDIDLVGYYTSHFFSILFFLLILGSALGALSGFVAVRRYLKI